MLTFLNIVHFRRILIELNFENFLVGVIVEEAFDELDGFSGQVKVLGDTSQGRRYVGTREERHGRWKYFVEIHAAFGVDLQTTLFDIVPENLGAFLNVSTYFANDFYAQIRLMQYITAN